MSKTLGLLLIVCGICGLVYHQFTYTSKVDKGKVGPVEVVVDEKSTVNIPVGAAVGTIVVGAGLLIFQKRK